MHLQEKHPMFLFTDEEKQAEKKEIGLKDSVIEEDIDAILESLKKEPHLAHVTLERGVVEKFLVVAKGSREKTKKRIDNFFKHRALAPELIQSRIEPLTKPDQRIWTFVRYALIPKLYDRKRITVIGFSPNASEFDAEVLYRNIILTVDLRLKYDYMFSDIWIVDFKGTGFGHLLRMNPVIVQKAANMYQESVGIRVKSIHCINAPVFAQHVVNFMKRFVKPKLIDRAIIHDSLESLQKHVPKEYLPEDYGGDLPSVMEFTDNLEREMKNEKTKELLLDYCKIKSDESKRPRVNYDEDCMVGSFKKLDFD